MTLFVYFPTLTESSGTKHEANVRHAVCVSGPHGGAVWGTLCPESRGQATALSTKAGDGLTKRYLH